MSDNKSNLVNVGAAWVKQSKAGAEYLSISTAGKQQRTKLFLEKEDGSFLQIKRMFATFTQNKKTPNSPDLQITVDVDGQEDKQE
jgi:hypothetical protein